MVLTILSLSLSILRKRSESVYEETKHLDTPIYIGLMPLTSSKNAEFLHNEVPGIKIDDAIREILAAVTK